MPLPRRWNRRAAPWKPRPDDPAGLTILPIVTGHGMDKYAMFRRVLDERAYGAALAAKVAEAGADLFITCTTPNDVLDMLRRILPPRLRIVWWLQDIYSVGIRSMLYRKLPLAGTLVGAIYRSKERHFAARADHIVSITPDFVPFLRRLGVQRPRKSPSSRTGRRWTKSRRALMTMPGSANRV